MAENTKKTSVYLIDVHGNSPSLLCPNHEPKTAGRNQLICKLYKHGARPRKIVE